MRDSRMFIMAGMSGQVPGTNFHADAIHNRAQSRLLYTLPTRAGSGTYIIQRGCLVKAGEYVHAGPHITDALFSEPRYTANLPTYDHATNHVGDIAIALTDGGWDLLEALEDAHQRGN